MKNNVARKTESLSYPSNPLAAMRELQELDALPALSGSKTEETKVSGATTLQVALATTSQVGSASSSEIVEPADTGTAAPEPATRKARPRESGKGSDEASTNPMERALHELLAKPYASDVAKGPFTVTTIKIPTDIWERLGWVSQLTGQTKQEVIASALKERFDKVAKGK